VEYKHIPSLIRIVSTTRFCSKLHPIIPLYMLSSTPSTQKIKKIQSKYVGREPTKRVSGYQGINNITMTEKGSFYNQSQPTRRQLLLLLKKKRDKQEVEETKRLGRYVYVCGGYETMIMMPSDARRCSYKHVKEENTRTGKAHRLGTHPSHQLNSRRRRTTRAKCKGRIRIQIGIDRQMAERDTRRILGPRFRTHRGPSVNLQCRRDWRMCVRVSRLLMRFWVLAPFVVHIIVF